MDEFHSLGSGSGSGSYATLDPNIKADVMDHICERYLSLKDPITRYELAAHIRRHNPPLYEDLVRTGTLLERGASVTMEDDWLLPIPRYREESVPLLLGIESSQDKEQ